MGVERISFSLSVASAKEIFYHHISSSFVWRDYDTLSLEQSMRVIDTHFNLLEMDLRFLTYFYFFDGVLLFAKVNPSQTWFISNLLN